MKKYKHIGWVKWCNTSTSWPIAKSKRPVTFVKPWPCGTYFNITDKPELDFQEDPEQFFWKKMYGSNN